jgi:hypothetical protein
MENKFQTGSFLDFLKKGKIQKKIKMGDVLCSEFSTILGLFVLMPTRMKAEQCYPDLNSGGLTCITSLLHLMRRLVSVKTSPLLLLCCFSYDKLHFFLANNAHLLK